jgi:hypothetical protein
VTSSSIYASATPNYYTYTIVCRSTNGTELGNTAATYQYGTTNTIYPPEKARYSSPAAQSVAWDSTSGKTITFIYTPIGAEASQTLFSLFYLYPTMREEAAHPKTRNGKVVAL